MQNMRLLSKRTTLVVLLTMLPLMSGCPKAVQTARPRTDPDKTFMTMRAGCIPHEDAWLCDHGTITKIATAIVDLKWDLKDMEDDREYLKQKCALGVEKCESRLQECSHDPWCLGPVIGSVFIAIGFGMGCWVMSAR